MTCPHCNGTTSTRNGYNKNGTPRYKCTGCGKSFSQSTGKPVGRPTEGDKPLTGAQRAQRFRERQKGA